MDPQMFEALTGMEVNEAQAVTLLEMIREGGPVKVTERGDNSADGPILVTRVDAAWNLTGDGELEPEELEVPRRG